MNFELQQPSQVISLATSALIVNVDVNVWTATKQDRAISDEVTSSKNASSEAGKFTKNLLANSPDHRALLNYRQTVYNWLQRCTYDWAGAMRLLPMINLEKFKKEYEGHEKAFDDLFNKFIASYPTMVSDAAFKQGDMFNRSEYPEPQELRSKFRIKLFVTKVKWERSSIQSCKMQASDLSFSLSASAMHAQRILPTRMARSSARRFTTQPSHKPRSCVRP